MPDPKIVSRDEWLVARKELLAHEKELTHQRDAVNEERRNLPRVEIDKYNYEVHPGLPPGVENSLEGFGVSAFLREGDRVFNTYSMYGRGGDILMGTYNWLDLTALGRQEDWEQPPGRSDGPPQSWLHRHDEYEV